MILDNQKNKNKIVKSVFDDVLTKYDLMNDIMSVGIHRVWKKYLMNWLNPQKNTKLIDVASGTGDIAKLYLRKVAEKGEVYCIDTNNEMLKINNKKHNISKKIKYFCGNAEKLSFKDNYFDYYTISFGIRNVGNIDMALEEAYRVLKPGGRFICLEFSKVENEMLKKFYGLYSKILPKIGKIVVGKSTPYEYLIKSIEEFYGPEEFLKKIEKKNFKKTQYRNLTAGIVAIHSAWKI